MKKTRFQIFMAVCVCTLFLSSGLQAKSKLSKIKDNIKNTVNKAVKQTKDSFNKLVNNSKKDSKKKDHSKQAFFNALANPDQANIKGLDIYERRLEQKWEEIDKILLSIIWANQAVFTKNLEQAKAESKDKARLMLHDKIVGKYANTKAPLISFAADLQKEGDLIRKLIDELGDLKTKIKTFRDEENKNKLDQTLEKLVSFELNVEKLSIIVCDLLS
jgi:hypothetical protein